MSTTIEAITSELQFTPDQTARVHALLAGRGLDPYHYVTTDVLEACRRIEREDGWSMVADDAEVFRRGVAAGLVGFQLGSVWEVLEKRRHWGHFALTDVLEAFINAETDTWGLVP